MMKNQKTKKITSIVLVTMMLFSCFACLLTVKASAATARWTGILSIDISMVFDGNEGDVSGIASKKSTATKIEGTLYVYKLVGGKWIYVDEWYNSKTRGTLVVGDTFVCESGVTYKAVFVVTAYTNGVPETETMEYIEVCP